LLFNQRLCYFCPQYFKLYYLTPVRESMKKVKFTKEIYLKWYHDMLLMRRFEEKTGQLYIQQKIRGFCHLYIGQEALVAGAESAITPDDNMITAYRDHAHPIGRGMHPKYIMAELYAKITGCSKGKGGSMHLFSKEFKSFLNLPRQELLYKSLEMTRTFFMRLFSETELLPSFMNQFADNASEWRDNDKSNYKINLSNCMKDMILKGEKIEQAQVVKVLEPYLKKTLLNVENKLENEKIEQDKVRHTPDKLSCSLFKQITFNIVKESLEMAMKRVDIDTIIHKQFLIKEIFESVNPIPYTNKEVTKEVVANLIRI